MLRSVNGCSACCRRQRCHRRLRARRHARLCQCSGQRAASWRRDIVGARPCRLGRAGCRSRSSVRAHRGDGRRRHRRAARQGQCARAAADLRAASIAARRSCACRAGSAKRRRTTRQRLAVSNRCRTRACCRRAADRAGGRIDRCHSCGACRTALSSTRPTTSYLQSGAIRCASSGKWMPRDALSSARTNSSNWSGPAPWRERPAVERYRRRAQARSGQPGRARRGDTRDLERRRRVLAGRRILGAVAGRTLRTCPCSIATARFAAIAASACAATSIASIRWRANAASGPPTFRRRHRRRRSLPKL